VPLSGTPFLNTTAWGRTFAELASNFIIKQEEVK